MKTTNQHLPTRLFDIYFKGCCQHSVDAKTEPEALDLYSQHLGYADYASTGWNDVSASPASESAWRN